MKGEEMAASAASVSGTRVPTTGRARLASIDILRGIVMVLMVLDHTRDFVHREATRFDPLDLTRTTTLLFFTRWVTHFCAPIFVFLAGTGARLQALRGGRSRDLSVFLATRGAWLVVLEFTVVRVGAWFNVDYSFLTLLQVLWVIGISMIVLAALIHLPLGAIALVGIGMIALHNLLDGVRVQGWTGPGSPVPGPLSVLWILLHQADEPVPIFGFPGPFLYVKYPLIPWIGVMAAGYVFGGVYAREPAERRQLLYRMGAGLAAAFVVIRAANVYGDPSRWHSQASGGLTILSFLNVTKYPPSLLYLLMTLGPGMLALAWLEDVPERVAGAGDNAKTVVGAGFSRPVTRAVAALGRVPLFFYLLQWPVAHAVAVVASLAAGRPIAHLFSNPPDAMTNAPPGAGFDLWVVYVCWALGMLVLIPPCLWFDAIKRRRRTWWLSYL